MTMTAPDPTTIFGPAEELEPELAAHIEHLPTIGAVLRHPLVYSVPYHPLLNVQLNAQYRRKLAVIYAADAGHGSPVDAIMMYEKPYRLQAFNAFAALLSDRDYWGMLGEVWVGMEWPGEEHMALAIRLFTSARKGRSRLMNEEERPAFAALPDTLTLYRGARRRDGLSWTLQESTAAWFAKRLGNHGTVYSMTIAKRDALAYFTRRDEAEILVHPRVFERATGA